MARHNKPEATSLLSSSQICQINSKLKEVTQKDIVTVADAFKVAAAFSQAPTLSQNKSKRR